jgi:hypothetical protein
MNNSADEWCSLVKELCPAGEILGMAAAFHAALTDMYLRGRKLSKEKRNMVCYSGKG